MKLEVYTVPHTGTRFAGTFLAAHNIPFNQRHVGGERTVPAWRRVLTVRNPYDAYLTNRNRTPSLPVENYIAMWGWYMWRTQWMDAFYLALDVVPDNRRIMLQKLVEFCGETPNFDIIDPWVEKWEKVGTSNKEETECPEEIKAILEFAHEWYEYYTIYWGARYRNYQNMLSEGK